jgi:hypothetical protein
MRKINLRENQRENLRKKREIKFSIRNWEFAMRPKT